MPDLALGIAACILVAAGGIGGMLTPLCFVLAVFKGGGRECLACGLVSTALVIAGFFMLASIASPLN